MSGVSASTQPSTGQTRRPEMTVMPPRIPQPMPGNFGSFNGPGFGFGGPGFGGLGFGPGFGGNFGRNPFAPPPPPMAQQTQQLPYWQPPIQTNPMNFAPAQPSPFSHQRRVGRPATPMDSQNWRNWVDMGRTGNPDNAIADNRGPLTGGLGPTT